MGSFVLILFFLFFVLVYVVSAFHIFFVWVVDRRTLRYRRLAKKKGVRFARWLSERYEVPLQDKVMRQITVLPAIEAILVCKSILVLITGHDHHKVARTRAEEFLTWWDKAGLCSSFRQAGRSVVLKKFKGGVVVMRPDDYRAQYRTTKHMIERRRWANNKVFAPSPLAFVFTDDPSIPREFVAGSLAQWHQVERCFRVQVVRDIFAPFVSEGILSYQEQSTMLHEALLKMPVPPEWWDRLIHSQLPYGQQTFKN